MTGGNVKLQWKPDFGARWAALDVDFEMYGKDHSTNTPIYDGICEVLGGRPPEHFTYELFLDEKGQKISKSKGNGLTIDEWLTYAATESLSYFMYQKPKTAKRMYFDVIPKAVDEYHQQLRAYRGQDIEEQVNNPVWHIHHGAAARKPHGGVLRDAAEPRERVRGQGQGGAVGVHPPLCARRLARDEPRSGRGGGIRGALLPRISWPRRGCSACRPTKERAAMEDLRARLAAWDGGLDAEAFAVDGLCGRQGARVRAAARLVHGALRGAARGEPGAAISAGSSRSTVSTRRWR